MLELDVNTDRVTMGSLRVAVVVTFLLVAALGVARPSAAQTEDPSARANEAPVRIGPLRLAPSIALTNFGIDTNVFNNAASEDPRRDFTFTMAPRTDAWLRVGRVWLMGSADEAFVYYREFESERAANHRYSGTARVGFNRLAFAGRLNWASVRDRPGFEIDARSQRKEKGMLLAAAYRVGAKASVGARFDRQRVDFDKGAALFSGQNLQFELNRTMATSGLEVRYRLTPLTTVGVDAVLGRDRFEFSPVRDADSTRVVATVALDPLALIKGTAAIGVRSFRPLSDDLADFNGLTALADLTYVVRSSRIGLQSIRDIQYSYDVDRPFYVQTGFSVSLTQHLFGPIQGAARLGRQQLAYRVRAANGVSPPREDPDVVRTAGGSVGYRLARERVVSFDVDHMERRSPRDEREYRGLRMGLSVTYGF